jgi:hypothetical protein
MDAGSVAPSCGSAIKHRKMALEGLAGRFWLKSNTPHITMHALFEKK